MNKSAAGSRNFSHSHSGISASGIGGVGGSLCQLITERVNFVVFLHIAAASPKCTVRYAMVTETQSNAFCFHFLVFYKKHAFSLFCSSIQGLCILCVRHWECGKKASSEYHKVHFLSSALLFLALSHISVSAQITTKVKFHSDL